MSSIESQDIDQPVDCSRIGYQIAPNGRIVSGEFLLSRQEKDGKRRVFSINVIGIPQEVGFHVLEDNEPPSLPLPRLMLEKPEDVCQFLCQAPFPSLRSHAQLLSEEAA